MSDPSNSAATQAFLKPIERPELVFGLVAPIGTDLTTVSKILIESLKTVNYSAYEIHVTNALREFGSAFELRASPLEDRYDSFINAANDLRFRLRRKDALALLSVAAVRDKRRSITGDNTRPPPEGTAYILNQFKRPEEIETLRQIYDKAFIQISAYCSKQRRLDNLAHKISDSHYNDRNYEGYRSVAYQLILRDAEEENIEYGQRVRDAFPLADAIINADREDLIRQTCDRFIRAYFSDFFITPTIDEYGSFLAKSVSLRSADLSRQVGAVALTKSGEIIAAGCNEVPKAGGGTYWEGGEYDFRDFRLGSDPSADFKRRLVQDLFRRLRDGWLHPDREKQDISDLVEQALFDDDNENDNSDENDSKKTPVLKDSDLMNILEFGRVIHAEMSVISDAARLGRNLKNATLYCTTFPCHICARHIVAAGIDRVVYIEPYAKSVAGELYADSIAVEGEVHQGGPKVCFDHFVGIAPQRFAEIFTRSKRKNKRGEAFHWEARTAKPILKMLVPTYLQIETGVLTDLEKLLETKGLMSP